MDVSSDETHVVVISHDHKSTVICKEIIPIKGTHSFTAKYEHTGVYWDGHIGVARGQIDLNGQMDQPESWSYYYNGNKRLSGKVSKYGSGYIAGDKISIEINREEKWIEFFKNGKSQGKITHLHIDIGDLYFAVSAYGVGESWRIVD